MKREDSIDTGETVEAPTVETPQVGLHGADAEAFLAQWGAADRSNRRDWFPVVVALVVVGLLVVASSGVFQQAWHELRQYQVQRRLERPRAGKSWTEHNRVNGEAPDLR